MGVLLRVFDRDASYTVAGTLFVRPFVGKEISVETYVGRLFLYWPVEILRRF
jgi:hypothetical protein